MNGQTARTNSHGIAYFNFGNLSAGNYTVAVDYGSKHVSQPVQIASTATKSSPQSVQVALVSDKFNPSLLLLPVAVLVIAGAYFARPWNSLARASIEGAADHIVTSDRPTTPDPTPGHPHHQAPGTVYSPHGADKPDQRD